jgi:biotin synthase
MNQLREEVDLARVEEIYLQALTDLLFEAHKVHRSQHDPQEVQFCTLSSIKTGACIEDCAYCSQSSRYKTKLKIEPLLSEEEILRQAAEAKKNASTRFCMGAAWRDAPEDERFSRILSVVRKVSEMGLEPCVTLGMLNQEQAYQLKEAGLHSYNHNIDTSRDFYKQIISTRTFDDRLQTIEYVQKAGIALCCGGILGLGESRKDRFSFLQSLAQMNPHPKSIPINVLVPIEGTPLYEEAIQNPLDPFELIRTIATARILMPKSDIRLSAGRTQMSDELQAMAFFAGANSIHTGEKLLTTANAGISKDHALMERLGMKIRT